MKLAIPDKISPSYFVAEAAIELGFFKAEGLDVSLELVYPVDKAYEALRDGKILFIADLQPYLDGYYAVVEAYQYAKYGMLPAGEIWTGAQILTKDNVDKVGKRFEN